MLLLILLIMFFFLLEFPRSRVFLFKSWRIQLSCSFSCSWGGAHRLCTEQHISSLLLLHLGTLQSVPHQIYRSTSSWFPCLWGPLTPIQQTFCSQAVLMYKWLQSSSDLGHASSGQTESSFAWPTKHLVMVLSCLSSLISSTQPTCLNF